MTRFVEASAILDVGGAAGASDVYTSALGFEELRPPNGDPWGKRLASFREPRGHLLHVTAKL